MKARGKVLIGFLSVLAATFALVAICCLCIDVAQASCSGSSCDNCVPNSLSKCVKGAGDYNACNTGSESCDTCKCEDVDEGAGTDCKCRA